MFTCAQRLHSNPHVTKETAPRGADSSCYSPLRSCGRSRDVPLAVAPSVVQRAQVRQSCPAWRSVRQRVCAKHSASLNLSGQGLHCSSLAHYQGCESRSPTPQGASALVALKELHCQRCSVECDRSDPAHSQGCVSANSMPQRRSQARAA